MTSEARLRGVVIGAGYFSQFQYEAWNRIPEVEIVGAVDRDESRAKAMQEQYEIPHYSPNYRELIDAQKPDFIDIITPPQTHLDMCQYAAERGIAIICQKPLAPTLEDSQRIVELARRHNVPFMVHENFRWQPWYREIKRILDAGTLGEVFHVHFQMRTGDGWGDDAYLARQPFFRDYTRLLVYETGVHFIDTFRFLLGDIESIYANLRRLNPVIRGEDMGQIFFRFQNGATAIWDANRYNEVEVENPRYTFGTMRIDAAKGHLLLDTNGKISIKLLGQPIDEHAYHHEDINFAGDCVYALQRHFVDELLNGGQFESSGEDYLNNVRAVEACYESSSLGRPVGLE